MNQVFEASKALYVEDLRVGQRFTSGPYHMDAARMKAFAAEFDPQPFHIDEAAAERTIFHGLVASGWHTASATMQLLVAGGLPIAGWKIGLSCEIAWPNPTRPGDTLRVESEILELLPSRSKPNQVIVTARSITINQNGDPVQVLKQKILAFKRPDNPADRGTAAL